MKKIYLILILFCAAFNAQTQNVPKLTSMNVQAGVTPVIYLDFDGYYVQDNTRWTGYTDGKGFYAEPADFNMFRVQTAFEVVAEDFRPFIVAVTTDSAVYNAAPIDRRLRVVITPTHEWYGWVGGVAFYDAFGMGDDTPVWVFSNLLSDDSKFIGEAASHEIGHGMGLIHHHVFDQDCNYVYEYNSGYGDDETIWAPIMGTAYNANLATWDNGVRVRPTHCEARLRTDLELIRNYVSLKNDDHTGQPTPLAVESDSGIVRFNGRGMIRSLGDRDPFTFTLTEETDMVINVRSPYVQEHLQFANNLDARLLVKKEGGWEETVRPYRRVGVNYRRKLEPGTYIVEVSGDDNEWMTNYASLGNFEIIGYGTTSDAQLIVDMGNDTSLCEMQMWDQGYFIDADPLNRNPDSTYYTWTNSDGHVIQEGYDASAKVAGVVRPGTYMVHVFNSRTTPTELFDTLTISSILSIQPSFTILSYDSSYCEPVVTFGDNSTSECSLIDRIVYDFGDGSAPEESYAFGQIEHRFPGAGTYLVKQTVYNVSGQSVDFLSPVKVHEPASRPANVLGPDLQICVNSLVTLDPEKLVPDNVHWYWLEYANNGPRKVGPGQYILGGFIIDEAGNSKHCDFTDTIVITSSPVLLPDFEVQYNAFGSVTFVNKTTTCDNSEASNYRWIVSDGTETTEESPTMRFTGGQTIRVTLIASNGTETDAIEKEVTIDFLRKPFARTVLKNYPGTHKLPKAKGNVVKWEIKDRPVVVNGGAALRLEVSGLTRSEYQLLGVDGRLYGKGVLMPGLNVVDILQVPRGIFYLHTTGGGENKVFKMRK